MGRVGPAACPGIGGHMPLYTQENRLIKLTTPLGEDALIVTRLRGREAISELFHFELTAVWQDAAPMNFKAILGKSVTIKFDFEDPPRYVNGIVQSVESGIRDRFHNLTQYTLHIVPNTWMLTHSVQSRIFQQKSVTDIIQKVITDRGYSSTFKIATQATYQPRDYCVQYRETDFAYISRLMESEGIYYYFQHDETEHTLAVA